MIWFRLALKNILRRKARSVFTLLGVTIAITVLYSILAFQINYEKGLKDELTSLGAQIMIVPKGCPYEAATIALHGGKWPRYLKEDNLTRIKATPGVGRVAGIVMDAIFDPAKKKNMIFLGIDEDYPTLRANWEIDGSWFTDDNSIILGSTVAAEENKKIGDQFFLKEKNTNFTVSAVLKRTNTQDDGFYFLPKKTLQQIFGLEDKLVVILIQAANVSKIEELTLAIRDQERDLNVFPLTELLNNMSKIIQSTKVFILTIVLVAIITATMGILNTILMAIFERTREIGMMKAIGASRFDIFKLTWAETIILGITGGLCGISVALIMSRIIGSFLTAVLPYAPKGTLVGFSPNIALLTLLFSILMGLLSGLYPSLVASSVKPIVAIRTE